MKILHTADWHIGKQLYREDLQEDLKAFFSFLMTTIEDQEIDVLLVSGDIFDYANPSNESKKLYLDLLGQLRRIGLKNVVITAGNHDSISYLESSKEILDLLDIHVIGSPDNIKLLPLTKNNVVEAVAIPVPFIADRFLRKGMEMASEEDKIEASRNALLKELEKWSVLASTEFPGIPRIAMAHMFVQGAGISDSERKIQIGNLAGVSTSKLEKLFEYLALGHIHKPQNLRENVRYSGSPIPLSFSEHADPKRMIVVEIDGVNISYHNVPIPSFRKLIRVKGSLDVVENKLRDIQNKQKLTAFVEVIVEEDKYDPIKINRLKEIEGFYQGEEFRILSSKILFSENLAGTQHGSLIGQHIGDLDPLDVFEERIKSESLDAEEQQMMRTAFLDILEETNSTRTYENQ